MIELSGKSGIKVKVLCDSISEEGNRLTTFECEYPRIIHSEFLTHCMLVRNSASSRAIPFAKMQEQLTGVPVRFGANQSGMQDRGEHDAPVILRDGNNECILYSPQKAWQHAKDNAIIVSQAFHAAGYHKQIVNRLTEPFQMIKTIMSATEWKNFFWLRNHEDADPTLGELARVMQEAYDTSVPIFLKPGEWHLPYITLTRDESYPDSKMMYADELEDGQLRHYILEYAIKISCARCAAVSFRNEDYTLEKSIEVYNRLIGSDRKHASAFEHCGTPIDMQMHTGYNKAAKNWDRGITHMDKEGNLWSGKFKGWIQYRKLIEGENYE